MSLIGASQTHNSFHAKEEIECVDFLHDRWTQDIAFLLKFLNVNDKHFDNLSLTSYHHQF